MSISKKEAKKMLEEINSYKKEYIFNRYNGTIKKYEKAGNTLIEQETCFTIDLNNTILLGKASENIIDLIEVGDLVNEYKILKIDEIEIKNKCKKIFIIFRYGEKEIFTMWNNEDIESIVTKEQLKLNEFNL